MTTKYRKWATRKSTLALATASGALLAATATTTIATSAASAAVQHSLNQCANGAAGSPQTCTGSNWQNGDLNPQNSHWAESQSVPFRVQLSGLSSGTHTLVIQYQTVEGGKHAYDYLTSFDATEKTSPTTGSNLGDDDPCSGVLSCDASTPTSTASIPSPDLSGLNTDCGSTGTPPALGSTTGDIKLYGPAGDTLGTVTYDGAVDQTSGKGCVTLVDIPFTLSSDSTASQPLVIAWGGHIASDNDWGAGQGAGSIKGAPYHMWVNSLDGQKGSEERSLKINDATASPQVATVIEDSTGAAVTSVTAGTEVHDTATLTGAADGAAGTVTYELFDNGTCSGDPATTFPAVTVTDGVVPDSPSATPVAGTYSFLATYSGDSSDTAATGSCEGPLTVNPFVPAQTASVSAAKSEPSGQPADVNPFDPSDNTITYDITLSNSGQAGATGVSVTDQVPTGTTLVAGSISNGGTADSNGLITWSGLAVPMATTAGPGTTTVSFEVTVDAPSSGTDLNGHVIPNTATYTVPSGVTAPDGCSAGDSGSTCQTNTVDNTVLYPIVSAVKTAAPAPLPAASGTVKPSDSITYTISVSDSGQVDASGVTVTDQVPAGTTLVPGSITGGGSADNAGLITWSGLAVAMAGPTTLSFRVTVDSGDSNGQVINNTAGYTAPTSGVAIAGDGGSCSTTESGQTCVTDRVQHEVAVATTQATDSTTTTPPTTTAPTTTPPTTAAPTTTQPTLAAPQATVAPTTAAPRSALAFTGADPLRTVGLGLSGIGAGLVLMLAARRRRSGS